MVYLVGIERFLSSECTWASVWSNPIYRTEKYTTVAADLKLGQYVKLPPRATFVAQMVGTFIGSILQIIIMKSIISAQREVLLSVQGTNIWSGQAVQSYNSQSISWGALGHYMYAPDRPYFISKWYPPDFKSLLTGSTSVPMALLIGLALPIPFWIIHQYKPTWKADKVLTPGIVYYIGYTSVGVNSGHFSAMLVGIFSQLFLRRTRSTFFRNYNFLIAAALEGGTSFMWAY